MGLLLGFFKAAWAIIGSDFVAAIQSFFENGMLLREVVGLFLRLVVGWMLSFPVLAMGGSGIGFLPDLRTWLKSCWLL
jgi:hypothetical protein